MHNAWWGKNKFNSKVTFFSVCRLCKWIRLDIQWLNLLVFEWLRIDTTTGAMQRFEVDGAKISS